MTNLPSTDFGHTQIISYEEYHPYGTTAYQASQANVEVRPKSYRYTGKERDEETRLYYYGARYYAAWLGRWMSSDRVRKDAGICTYEFVSNNPVIRVDPHGNLDKKAKEIADWLQDTVNEFLESNLRRLSGEEPGPFGTRLHDYLTGSAHSRFTPESRLFTEVIVDTKGKILRYGGSPGEANKFLKELRKKGLEAVTVDVGILKPGMKAGPRLVGKSLSDVLEVGMDYKTGGAKLASRQKALFKKLGLPLVPLKKGGNLAMQITEEIHRMTTKTAQPVKKQVFEKIQHETQKVVGETLPKKVIKAVGKKIIKSLPIIGGVFTFFTAEGSVWARTARAVAGEIGIGPLDLETLYDAGKFLLSDPEVNKARHAVHERTYGEWLLIGKVGEF